MKESTGAPWRGALCDTEREEETELLTRGQAGSGRRKFKEEVRKFLQEAGVVSSRLLQLTFEKELFVRGDAPYPLEAYVSEAVRYLETLGEEEREVALGDLGNVCGIVGELCQVVLCRDPTTSLMALRPEPFDTPETIKEGDPWHVYSLGVELWKARGHTVDELLGRKGEAWLTGGEGIFCADGLNAEDYACLRARLTKELSGLRVAERALGTAMLETFLPILDSDPDWARRVVPQLVQMALRENIEEEDSLYSALDLCERYDVVLPDNLVKGLMRTCVECRSDEAGARLMARCLGRAQNSGRVAEHAWGFAPGWANEEIVAYMPLSCIDEILDDGPEADIVRKLAERKDVSEDLRLAKRCVEASAGAVGVLLRNGSVEVQRYLLESGKYVEKLVRVIAQSPGVIRDGVKVPSPIVAKALATGSVSQKQGMLGHLGKWRI